MTSINITAGDASAANQALDSLGLDGARKAQLLNELGINLAENTRLRFVTQTGPDNKPWPQSWRAKRENGQTLRDTSILVNSITHAVSGDSVAIGSNVAYAPWLHFGAVIKPKKGPFLRFKLKGFGWITKKQITLPARPFIGFDEEDQLTMVDVISGFLDG